MFKLWYSQTFRLIAIQVVLATALCLVALSAFHNVQTNLEARDIQSGFGFLDNTAGFNIIMHLIDYDETSHYLQVFWVGLLNTLLVSVIGIFIATILGFIIGVGRLSSNGLVRFLAACYVETIRNIPLLLQIFFWYFAVLRALPRPKASWQLWDSFFLNNRGLYAPKLFWTEHAPWLCLLFISVAVLTFLAHGYAKHLKIVTGRQFPLTKIAALVGGGLIVVVLFVWGSPVSSLGYPELKGFNFKGGVSLIPEFIALVLALSMYTAAFIAEVVRLGIQSVDQGQKEAAHALGLSQLQTLTMVIIPQALKVILPPLTNQYLNLAKNSSLAAAIAYPDLVSVFAGTVLNQTGQAVEVIGMTMAVYLVISLSISMLMLSYEKMTAWGKE